MAQQLRLRRKPHRTFFRLRLMWTSRSLIGDVMRLLRSVVFCQITLAASLVAQLQMLPSTLAQDNGQWENSPAHVRQWFEGLRQPDNPKAPCCGEADAYEADLFEVDEDRYVAIITDGKGETRMAPKSPCPIRS